MGTISFSTSQLTVNEEDGTVLVPIFREGDLSGTATV